MATSKQYQIEITDECKREIKKIYNYIKDELYAEQAAQNLLIKLEECINQLAYTPKMYRKI